MVIGRSAGWRGRQAARTRARAALCRLASAGSPRVAGSRGALCAASRRGPPGVALASCHPAPFASRCRGALSFPGLEVVELRLDALDHDANDRGVVEVADDR